MKQRVSRAMFLSFAFLILVTTGSQLFADERTVALESVVIQEFDDAAKEPWFVVGSKFTTAGYPVSSYVDAYPISLYGSKADTTGRKSLGIGMLFDRMEYNWVDIVPGEKKGEGNSATFTPKELSLPGRIAMLDMWVWSANFNYYLEAYVRDYKGIVYTLPMGNLNFIGWKNLRVNLPSSIPQEKKYLPAREGLSFVKFRIWTRPTERVSMPVPVDSPHYKKAVYFYIDHLKVLTDTFETLFDGDNLSASDAIEKSWGGGK